MQSNKAPQWILALFFAPLGFAAVAVILDAVLHKTCQRWRQPCKSDDKRRSAVTAFIKAMVYITGLGLAIPVVKQVAATWGGVPLWPQDAALSTYFSVGVSLGVMSHIFELIYRRNVGYDVWLHHTASVVSVAIAVTLAESDLQRALLASWTLCMAFNTSFDAVFFVALFAYYLQLDNFLAKKRLALFFMVSTGVIYRCVEVVPLAYTIASWGLLTVTSKVIMLTTMAAFVPAHILSMRTFWGIYRLNKRRVDELAKLLPVAPVKDPAVSGDGADP